MIKKIIALLSISVLLLSACNVKADKGVDSEKKTVCVTTSFLRDMTENLAGDMVEIETIIPAGDDPHLYMPKPGDLKKIKEADLILYHGIHFEGKMVDVLEEYGHAVSRDFKAEETGTMEEDGIAVPDPHFWFDIVLYQKACRNAAADLINLLPDEKDKINENLENYLEELNVLDLENKEMIKKIPKERRYLITPHDAFNYFSRYYDIPVMAPQGVSTETEVSNKDISDTAKFIIKNNVKAIFTESTTDPKRMEKLVELCEKEGHSVKLVSGEGNELFSDSLAKKGNDGDTYIDMYKHNVKLIVENLE